ncbi:hypothetical protein HK104_010346 [Borealophlyctis nickersoniae]|nr:hypothetical protein HK104_010346 [Borealophlyctis nickersoniae]
MHIASTLILVLATTTAVVSARPLQPRFSLDLSFISPCSLQCIGESVGANMSSTLIAALDSVCNNSTGFVASADACMDREGCPDKFMVSPLLNFAPQYICNARDAVTSQCATNCLGGLGLAANQSTLAQYVQVLCGPGALQNLQTCLGGDACGGATDMVSGMGGQLFAQICSGQEQSSAATGAPTPSSAA